MRVGVAFVAASFLLAASIAAHAAAPEEVAQRYFESVKSRDWEEAARYLDPQGLVLFKDTLLVLLEAGQEQSDELLPLIFGEGATIGDARSATTSQFFARVMDFVALFTFEPMAADFGDVEVLGSVPEGEDMVHVVARVGTYIQGVAISAIDVITLQKRPGGWYVAFTQDLDALLQLFEAMLESGIE